MKILDDIGSHPYLGKKLSLNGSVRVAIECNYRKKYAWIAFLKHKIVVLDRNNSVGLRLKFFDI